MLLPIQNFLTSLKTKVTSGISTLKSDAEKDLSTLWANNKFYIIGFGLIILFFKYRDLLINILVKSGQREVNSADKQDAILQTDENKDNQQANILVQNANTLANQNNEEQDPNWNLKED